MKIRPLWIVVVTVLLLVAGVVGVRQWSQHTQEKQRQRLWQAAELAGKESRWRDALALIQLRESQGMDDQRNGAWQELKWRALGGLREVPALMALYEGQPQAVARFEAEALLVGRGLWAIRQWDRAEEVRQAWRGRETLATEWFLWDADYHLVRGQVEEARTLLLSRSLPEKEEAWRQLRLAMLSRGAPEKAWEHLQRAYDADPRNPEVRTARAQVLEGIGQKSWARREWVSAVVADPNNPLWRDQLAEFYLRHQDYALAVETLKENLALKEAPEFFRVKEFFWRRITGGQVPTEIKIVPGQWSERVQAWEALPAGEFFPWAEMTGSPSLELRQEEWWLRLLEALRRGEEQQALDWLQADPYAGQYYHVELYSALRMLLRYRLQKTDPAPVDFRRDPLTRVRHSGLEDYQRWAEQARLPAGETFMRSRQAVAGLLLIAGWGRAAFDLGVADTVPEGVPSWWIYAVGQGLRQWKGSQEAERWLGQVAASPERDLLLAEIRLGRGVPEAEKELSTLAETAGGVGFRAAWLLATVLAERGQLEEAEKLVQQQAELRASIPGRELLGRLWVARGQSKEAENLYRGMAEESQEAAVYLARQAVERQQYREAERMVESLVERYPEELSLQESLLEIRARRAKGGRP